MCQFSPMVTAFVTTVHSQNQAIDVDELVLFYQFYMQHRRMVFMCLCVYGSVQSDHICNHHHHQGTDCFVTPIGISC